MSGPARDLILVVDDDAETRAMLSTALRQAQFDVLSAEDGVSALALAAEARPRLMVLDAVMPGLSGFEVCRRMKATPGISQVPVIFLTGLAETEHVIEGLRAGGVDYVTKPIVLEELTARISVHLATARMAHSARVALDVAGRAMLAADRRGRVLWRTPQTEALLASLGLTPDDGLPAGLQKAIGDLIGRSDDPVAPSAKIDIGVVTLELAYAGGADGALYFRLSQLVEGREADLLRTALGLTAREAEVLVWIAAGKSNRDISEILNISPRTVNKHLEQVFTKLGVENRAAAAAIATRLISA